MSKKKGLRDMYKNSKKGESPREDANCLEWQRSGSYRGFLPHLVLSTVYKCLAQG